MSAFRLFAYRPAEASKLPPGSTMGKNPCPRVDLAAAI